MHYNQFVSNSVAFVNNITQPDDNNNFDNQTHSYTKTIERIPSNMLQLNISHHQPKFKPNTYAIHPSLRL